MNAAAAACLALAAVCGVATAETVRFSDHLYAKFHHERCLQCHQFNSPQSRGRAYGSHRNRYLCETCHKPSLTGLSVGEWMAPEGGRMDYTGKSPRETCQMALRNVGAGDKRELLRHHLLHDQRVLWAILGGMTPGGQRERVPGGYEDWQREVNAWLDTGMVCE